MQYSQCTANDGCTLAYQTSLLPPATTATNPRHRQKTCIILMHGFSGSSAYFEKNFAALSATHHWVVAPDMRGHGRSGRSRGGYHVARLAADLRDLVAHLRRDYVGGGDGDGRDTIRFVPVGCSIGAAVLWTYVELFGDDDFAGFVFVDQAPLQDRSVFGGDGDENGNGNGDGGAWDASKAHRGCYDEATTQAAQETWTRNPAAAHAGLVADCLGYRFAPEPEGGDDLSEERRASDERFFAQISAQCDPVWLARLLADHTRYDHREAIEEGVTVPTLVLAGRRTGCFPLEGMRETVKRVERGQGKGLARFVVFDSGHWLFWEEPERFNGVVGEFVDSCTK